MSKHITDKVRTLDNGAIVIPAAVTFAPGQPGKMFRKDEPCQELGGKCMKLTPEQENVWAEYKCPKEFFGDQPKRYELTIRYKTDDNQGDVSLSVRIGKKEPHYTTSIPIPTTGGEWAAATFLLETDIGGFKDSKMKIEIPVVNGTVFHIKDFTFAPPGAEETGEFSGPWFGDWLQELTEKVGGSFPILEEEDREALVEAAKNLQTATGETYHAMQLVATALENIQNKTEEVVQEAREAYAASAISILETMDETLESLDLDDPEVLQYLVLIQAKPANLAAYCHDATDEQKQRLMKLLKEDTDLLKQMILSGGAKNGQYGKALDIYYDIQKKMQPDKTILPKLQLACALELCQPLAIFDTETPVDAVDRYMNYENAYLEGYLDPAFENFSVWELRMVVDSDASNEELAWGRKMLLTYRPDMCYMGDQLWRYSSIVKTDVKYGAPNWTSDPKDMVQALAGGGKCGPRAFFGRFINKAFGNPTWGLLQPGHAALSKWTPSGWACVLGSDQGTKDGRDYQDFIAEVFMRKRQSDELYTRKVDMLVWMHLAETPGAINLNECRPNTPWINLAVIQRKRLAEVNKPFPQGYPGQCEVMSKIGELQRRDGLKPTKEEMIFEDDGTIILPCSSCQKSNKGNFAKCLDGGKQYNAEQMWWLEFLIPADKLPAERTKYKLTMKIASVHDTDKKPFQWIVTSAHNKKKPMKEYKVSFPYTRGLWAETEPIEIELGGGEEKLKLMRQKPCLPITVKDFKLTPA